MSDLKWMLENWKRENESLVRENERLRNRNDELVKEKVGLTFQLKELEKIHARLEEKHEETDEELKMLEYIYDIVAELVVHIKKADTVAYSSTRAFFSKLRDFQQQLLKRMKPYADFNELEMPLEFEDNDG